MGRALGKFAMLLLSALVDLDGEADGAALRRAVEHRTGRAISPGAVYTAMDRMEGKGLVASRVETTLPEQGGRRRKHYRLEAAGVEALRHALQQLRSMTDGLEERLASIASPGGRGPR